MHMHMYPLVCACGHQASDAYLWLWCFSLLLPRCVPPCAGLWCAQLPHDVSNACARPACVRSGRLAYFAVVGQQPPGTVAACARPTDRHRRAGKQVGVLMIPCAEHISTHTAFFKHWLGLWCNLLFGGHFTQVLPASSLFGWPLDVRSLHGLYCHRHSSGLQ